MNRPRITLLAALAVFLGLLAVSSPAGARTAGCTPGVRTVDGSMARIFCGPAKATVHLGAKTLSFSSGACERSGGGYVVNIGTFFAGTTKSTRPYFGLLIAKPKPGSYTRQTLAFRSGGVSRSAFVSVTLKTLRGGTFSGAIFGGGRITGSFSC